MKLAYLTEVAALMAAHGRILIERGAEPSNRVISDYYILNRNRFNRWMRDLTDLESGVELRDPLTLIGLPSRKPQVKSLAETILINEMLIRLWTILMMARERYHNQDQIRPVVHNVYLGQLSVRHKALSVCLADSSLSPTDVIDINRLRNSTERWTDLLGCSMMNDFNLWEYAFDRERAAEFLQDRNPQALQSHRSEAWLLILAGIRHSFLNREQLQTPVHEDDRRIIRVMMSCFPEDSVEMSFWANQRLKEARHG
ncbi:MAG: hypothetical protein KDA85_10085 [Planctomycetaceae bacterium]|nr:hypothetical protein [Planctomycetaceae bacterium]